MQKLSLGECGERSGRGGLNLGKEEGKCEPGSGEKGRLSLTGVTRVEG